MYVEQVPVLIVGGGLVGLSASLFLSWHGVPSLLVERYGGLAIHPRGRGFNPRSMELFRGVGLEQPIHVAGAGFADFVRRAKLESLAGEEVFGIDLPTQEDLGHISPARWCLGSQDRVEPILCKAAEDLGGELRFGVEVISLESDADGVSAIVRNHGVGDDHGIRARYLIAADGPRSGVRDWLGIGQTGPGVMRHQVSILFKADLERPLGGRRFSVCLIDNPKVQAIFGHDDTLTQGTLIVSYSPEEGESAEDYTERRCLEIVRAAMGDPGVEVDILSVLPWEMAALVAERYRSGRIFLAGDAVHVMPPVGGFGASTGIQDAHNLAWKLAYVLEGKAGEGLLDTYEEERRPVGAFTMSQGHLRVASGVGFGQPVASPDVIDELAVTFGYHYRSPAVISGEGGESSTGKTEATHPDDLDGRPGTRAPHLALGRDGESVSTLDLFGRGFTLLTGAEGGQWTKAAEQVGGRLGLDIDVHRIGADLTDADGRFPRAYGVASAGAVLVRPDGFVAWRSPEGEADPEGELEATLARILCREEPGSAA